MSIFRRLDNKVLASPQITAAEVAEAKELGVSLIINNRPEGESPDQTPGDIIESAAQKAGLDYLAIPISPAGLSDNEITAMADALMHSKGQVLAYCRSGTRSTFLWALAEATRGVRPADLVHAAADAGYDLAPIRERLGELASRK